MLPRVIHGVLCRTIEDARIRQGGGFHSAHGTGAPASQHSQRWHLHTPRPAWLIPKETSRMPQWENQRGMSRPARGEPAAVALICMEHRTPVSNSGSTAELPCPPGPRAGGCCLLLSASCSSPLCWGARSSLLPPSCLPPASSLNILAKSACPKELASRWRPDSCGGPACGACAPAESDELSERGLSQVWQLRAR